MTQKKISLTNLLLVRFALGIFFIFYWLFSAMLSFFILLIFLWFNLLQYLAFSQNFHHVFFLLSLRTVILKHWNSVSRYFLYRNLSRQHQLLNLQKFLISQLFAHPLHLQTKILLLFQVKIFLFHLCVKLPQKFDNPLIQSLIIVRLWVIHHEWPVKHRQLPFVILIFFR